MPPTLTYPGVYVVEVPSGVHTITGVATSIAAFFGQASMGPLNEAKECLSPSDFSRNFGALQPNGSLGQMVQQFFANGGSDCYVVRIAGSNGATAVPSTVTLKDVGGNPVLALNAASEGTWGNNLLVVVDYNTPTPDATFNLTAIYMNQGTAAQTEPLTSLSMDPDSSRYAPTFIGQSSTLLSVPTTQPVAATALAAGFSQMRYPFAGLADADAISPALSALFPPAGTGSISISVDGGPVTAVTLTKAGVNGNFAALKTYIEGQINNALGAASNTSVALSSDAASGGPPSTFFLRLTSSGTKKTGVAISRGPANDIASVLMAGVDQGGIEVPRYSDLRPAPNGTTFTGDTEQAMTALAGATVDQVTKITVDTQAIPLNLGTAGTPFYKGTSATDLDGIRENLQNIADQVNSLVPGWGATLAGYRLIITELRPNSPVDTDATFVLAATLNAAPFGAGFSKNAAQTPLSGGNDGGSIQPSDYIGVEAQRTGFWALDEVPIFNLMVVSGDGLSSEPDWQAVRSAAATYCNDRRAVLLLDAPAGWTKNNLLTAKASDVQSFRAAIGAPMDHCAVFYPRVQVNDRGTLRYMGVAGIMAGICAATDSARGVWSAPAGANALLTGVTGLEVTLTDKQNGTLNPLAVNCLRSMTAGFVNWGARTVAGFDNTPDDDYRYLNVRRFALFLESSLYDGTQWVVFQNNAEPLWAQIRMNISAFMMNLFRQGAFAGTTPQTAFFVKCDSETTTPNDQNLGIVNIVVGFAPLKPAEFVVISIQQISNLS